MLPRSSGPAFGLWSMALKQVLLPAGDLLVGQPMMRHLKLIEQAQWWSREQIEAEQTRRLRDLVEVSYREVPYYRDLLDKHGLNPTDIRKLSDLSKIPISRKPELRDAYPARITRSTGGKTWENSTSGSTGANFFARADSVSRGIHRASLMLALAWSGWRVGEPHLQTGFTKRDAAKVAKDLVLQCHYFSNFDLRDELFDSMLEAMDREKIDYVWGYPSSLIHLARRAQQKGWNRPLKALATWGDALYPSYRELFRQVFKAPVYDTYGCAEGFQVAAQPPDCFDHYLVHDLDVILEAVGPSGEPVRAGETGDLVVTRLHPGPMPFIRYFVGDRGISGGEELSRSGRGFHVLRSLEGRVTDFVVTQLGKRLTVHHFNKTVASFTEVESYQAEQTVVGAVTVRIKTIPSVPYTPALGERIVACMHGDLGSDIAVTIEPVAELPLTTAGKRRFIINKLQAAEAVGRAPSVS
jgi:phenylacetate-CoA ligase